MFEHIDHMAIEIIRGREDGVIPLSLAKVPKRTARLPGHLPHIEKAGEVNRPLECLIEKKPNAAADSDDVAR